MSQYAGPFSEVSPLAAAARSRFYPAFVIGTVSLAGFLIQMDASIVALVLPTLEQAFGQPVAEVEWVSVSYLLALGAMVIPAGRLSDIAGRKVVYMWGFISFIVGSVLCGLAPTLGALIAFRVLQGFGAALLQANSSALVTAAVPRETLGRSLAFLPQQIGQPFAVTIIGLFAWGRRLFGAGQELSSGAMQLGMLDRSDPAGVRLGSTLWNAGGDAGVSIGGIGLALVTSRYSLEPRPHRR